MLSQQDYKNTTTGPRLGARDYTWVLTTGEEFQSSNTHRVADGEPSRWELSDHHMESLIG